MIFPQLAGTRNSITVFYFVSILDALRFTRYHVHTKSELHAVGSLVVLNSRATVLGAGRLLQLVGTYLLADDDGKGKSRLGV
jgi:hypothetical protein